MSMPYFSNTFNFPHPETMADSLAASLELFHTILMGRTLAENRSGVYRWTSPTSFTWEQSLESERQVI